MDEAAKSYGRRLLRPLVRLLAWLRVPPSAVTLVALPLGVGSAFAFGAGDFLLAGILLALLGLCDVTDGELARFTGRGTALGAFVDSTVDRFTEVSALTGIYWHYMRTAPFYGFLAVIALISSLMVSYVRARAEGAGMECRVGLFERPVRIGVLIAGSLLPGTRYMPIALGVVAIGATATIIQRLVHILGQRATR